MIGLGDRVFGFVWFFDGECALFGIVGGDDIFQIEGCVFGMS